jgi:hypothetical protein
MDQGIWPGHGLWHDNSDTKQHSTTTTTKMSLHSMGFGIWTHDITRPWQVVLPTDHELPKGLIWLSSAKQSKWLNLIKRWFNLSMKEKAGAIKTPILN